MWFRALLLSNWHVAIIQAMTRLSKFEGNRKNAQCNFTGQWVQLSWHHISSTNNAPFWTWTPLMNTDGLFFPSDFPPLSTNHRSSSANGTLELGGVTFFIIQGLTNLDEKKIILFSILLLIYIMILGGNSIIIYVVQRTV